MKIKVGQIMFNQKPKVNGEQVMESGADPMQ
jgi:hypothetical protein